jgi:phosphatidylinositol alpha-1,6-mannosyltransferase
MERLMDHLVACIDFPPSIGGIQQYVNQIWGDGSVGEVTVLAPKMAGDTEFDSAFPGRVHRFSGGRGIGAAEYLLRVTAALRRHLDREKVVHVTTALMAPAFIPYLPWLKGRLVVYTHALEVTYPPLQLPIRTLLRAADHVATVSDFTRGLVLARGADPAKVSLVSPGGDSLKRRFPSASGDDFRRTWDVRGDEFLILTVSRVASLYGYKGLDRAIEVARLLKARGRNVRWLVAGDGDDVQRLRRLAEECGVGDTVTFIGYVSDLEMANAYAACDAFCLLSREEWTKKGLLAEGYGIVFVEANSFGKPVIGLRRGGTPNAVLDGETGILVDRDEPEDIAAAIVHLMDQPAEAARLGANGMERALTSASWQNARMKMLRIAEQLVRCPSTTALRASAQDDKGGSAR